VEGREGPRRQGKVGDDPLHVGRGTALRAVAVLHNPTMPKSAAKLWTLLGAEAKAPVAEGPAGPGRLHLGPAPTGATLTKGDARLTEDAGNTREPGLLGTEE
jgi:hypothetical protein